MLEGDKLTLKFRGREAPEGWYLFFENLQWGPYESRAQIEALAERMIADLSTEFHLPVVERRDVERSDKELMPWVKRRKGTQA